MSPVAFRVELPTGCRAHDVLHTDCLKLVAPHGIDELQVDAVEPLFDESDGAELFKIGDIVDSRRSGRNKSL